MNVQMKKIMQCQLLITQVQKMYTIINKRNLNLIESNSSFIKLKVKVKKCIQPKKVELDN